MIEDLLHILLDPLLVPDHIGPEDQILLNGDRREDLSPLRNLDDASLDDLVGRKVEPPAIEEDLSLGEIDHSGDGIDTWSTSLPRWPRRC